MGVWRMVGRGRKEKDLMVGQISFLWGGYGWVVLCKAGWLGLGGDKKITFSVPSDSRPQQSQRGLCEGTYRMAPQIQYDI